MKAGQREERASQPKLLVVVSHLWPMYGLEKLAVLFAEELGKYYEIEILSLGRAEISSAGGATVASLGKSRTGWYRALSALLLLPWSNRKDADVTVLVGLWAAIPWLLSSFRSQKATVVWEHSLLSEKFSFDTRMRLLAKFARVLYRRCAYVVGVSEPHAEDLRRIGHKRVRAIANPIEDFYDTDATRQRHAASPGQFRVVSVGSISEIKNHALAIETMSRLDLSFSLLIVGDGPLRAGLTKRVKLMGLEKQVTFMGFQQPEQVKKILRESDALLHVSRSETFGLVLVEGAEAQLPVVSARNLSSEYLIPRFVPGLVADQTSVAIAEALCEIRAGGPSDSDFAKARLERRKAFSVASFVTEWQSVIEDVVANSRRRG